MGHRMVQGFQVLRSVCLLCQCADKPLGQIFRDNQALWVIQSVTVVPLGVSAVCVLRGADIQGFPNGKT